MNKFGIIFGCIVLVLALSYAGFPQEHAGQGVSGNANYSGMSGNAYNTTSPEQNAQLDSLYRNFNDTTNALRDQIWAKSTELNTILSMPDLDYHRARPIQAELSALKAKFDQEQLKYEVESRKITPSTGYGGNAYHGNMGGFNGSQMGGHGRGCN